jgi:hypothetical protein
MMSWIRPVAERQDFSSEEQRSRDKNTNSILSSWSLKDPALSLCLGVRLVAMRGAQGDGRGEALIPPSVWLGLIRTVANRSCAFEDRPRCSPVSACSKRRDAPISRTVNASLAFSRTVRTLPLNLQLWASKSTLRNPSLSYRRKDQSPHLLLLLCGPRRFLRNDPLLTSIPHTGPLPLSLQENYQKSGPPRSPVPYPHQPRHL